MPELNDWSYTGDMRPDAATQARIAAKFRQLGIDPAKDRERAMKVAIAVTEACNTSLADYVWLPISFDGERAKVYWKDEWRIEEQ